MPQQLDPQITLDLLARHMWIADRLDKGVDGIEAAMQWDEDELLTDTYEKFETMAYEAVSAETTRRREQDREAGYGAAGGGGGGGYSASYINTRSRIASLSRSVKELLVMTR